MVYGDDVYGDDDDHDIPTHIIKLFHHTKFHERYALFRDYFEHAVSCLLQVGVRVFHDEDVDTGLSFLKLNEVGPATTELVDNEIKRLLQVKILN